MSFWSLILYFSIPGALLLLLIILFAHGAFQGLNDVVMSLIGRLIFTTFNAVLPVPLIHFVLAIHVLTAVILGTNVYQRHQNPSPLGHDTQAHHLHAFNSKGWRQQRNLYLVCLSLVLWWMLYSVYTLKKQLDKANRQLNARPAVQTSVTQSSVKVVSAPVSAGVSTVEPRPAVAKKSE